MVAATSANNVLRTVCAHDCPDACSVLVTIEAGRVVRTVEIRSTHSRADFSVAR